MISAYPSLNLMFFKFLLILNTLFAPVYFFKYIPYLVKLCQKKVTKRSGENFTRFCFCFFWKLVFMCKVSQLRIHADLLRFQSRVKDVIHKYLKI